MTRASENIRAIVSGLPRSKRRESRLMVLQSFADDSGSNPNDHTFVLGGFVASVDSWERFSDEWQVALSNAPTLEYFKMAEAVHLRGQFSKRNGWTDAKVAAKLDNFIDIILAHTQCSLHVSVRNADFARYLKSVPMPHRSLATDTPYLMLLTQYVLNFCRLQRDMGGTEPVRLVFDQQTGHSEEAVRWWPQLKQIAQEDGTGHLIGGYPAFEDEKQFLPLQAADLFAWEQRSHFQRNRTLAAPVGRRLQRLKAKPSIGAQITGEVLAALQKAAIALVQQHLEHDPNARLVGAGKAARRRSKVSRERPRRS